MASTPVSQPAPAHVATPERASTLFEPSRLSNDATLAFSRAPTLHKDTDDVEKSGQQTPMSSSDEEGTQEKGNNNTGRSIRAWKWFLVCVSIYISAFLYGLDTTIAADVQGAVVEEFGHIDQLAWIGTGFPLGSVAVILLVGNLYGSFNMKWIYIGSIAMFEIGSVLCGAAPNMNAMIVGRVLAGAGGSGVYLGALNYFTMLTSAEERGLYISLTGFFWGVGATLGPIVGGAFSESVSWRWAFYINLVIGAAAAPIYIFFLPAYHAKAGKSVRDSIAHFDFFGLALIAATWVFFTVGFSVAGNSLPWNDGTTIALLVLFGVLFLAAFFQQYFTIFTSLEHRAFPGHLLLSRTQILLFIATAASTSSLFVVVYYIPIYFQFVHSDSPILAAVRLMPYVVVTVVVNVVAGHLLSKIRYYMPIYLVAGLLITIGGALLTVYLDPATSESAIYGFTVITAVGTGLTLQLGYAVASLAGKNGDTGHAINFQNVSQIGSTVVCLVIAGQVFQSTAIENLTRVLAGLGFTPADIASAVDGTQSTLFGELSEELRVAAIGAIVSAMQKSFILVFVAGAAIVAAAVGMKRERLFGEIITA